MFFSGLHDKLLNLGNVQEELSIFIDEEKWNQTDVLTETGRMTYLMEY